MRIGIDARLINESGVGRYIRNLLLGLQKIDQKNEYFVFLLEKDFQTLKFSDNFKNVLANFRWYSLTEQVKLPGLLNKYNLDLVHFPHFNVPIFYKGKFIVTVHDLIHQHFQMRRSTTRDPLIYKLKQLGYNKIFKAAVGKSKKILTVSKFVKEQLRNEWNIDESKIITTYEAVDEEILKIAGKITKKEIEETLSKFEVKRPYIFYIGNAHPHKNVEGLIRAFRVVREEYRYLQLVLSGNDHYFWQRIKKEFESRHSEFISGSNKIPKQVRNDVVFTGFITDEELVALYKGAEFFVLPSFEEGFGIPVLEAFSLGCPVVCSNAGSLPEVGGDAAIYFDPKSKDDLAEKIILALSDQNLRKQLIEKGEKRYKEFSWEILAKKTLEIYESVG